MPLLRYSRILSKMYFCTFERSFLEMAGLCGDYFLRSYVIIGGQDWCSFLKADEIVKKLQHDSFSPGLKYWFNSEAGQYIEFILVEHKPSPPPPSPDQRGRRKTFDYNFSNYAILANGNDIQLTTVAARTRFIKDVAWGSTIDFTKFTAVIFAAETIQNFNSIITDKSLVDERNQVLVYCIFSH